jgi:hypothetical protein
MHFSGVKHDWPEPAFNKKFKNIIYQNIKKWDQLKRYSILGKETELSAKIGKDKSLTAQEHFYQKAWNPNMIKTAKLDFV